MDIGSRICAIYIRKSRKDKDKRSARLEAQREELPAYASSMGWNYEVYDEGYRSAARGKIAGLVERARMEADIRAGKIGVVLTIEISRLSRDDTNQDFSAFSALCRDNQVLLAVPGQIIDLNNSDQWALSSMGGVLSSAEMQKFKERTANGRSKNFRDGKWLGGITPPPYKYDYEKSVPVIDPEQLPRMKEIWRLSLTLSAKAIAEMLGLPEINVRRALTDRRLLYYQAKRIDNTGNEILCEWEPVMTAEEAALIIAARRTRRSNGNKLAYGALLSALKILRCGYCGNTAKTFQGKRTKAGERHDYYACQRKNGQTCPESRMVKQASFNTIVSTNLLNTLSDIEALKHYWLASQDVENPEKELATLSKQATKLEAQKKNLVDMVANGGLDFADVKAKKAEIEAGLTLISERRREIFTRQDIMPGFDALEITPDDWWDFEIDDQREIISEAIERIDLYATYAIITYKFPKSESGDRTSRVRLPELDKPKKKKS